MPPGVWVPDQGDGSYINPVLNGDYSDPDVVRVGDDFYLTASSFTNIPGLPVLHSKDLVNWTLIGYALDRNVPAAHHAAPRHGGGVWAPAIRHHGGKFYIYYPDPDFGIYMVSATDPKGPWTAPVMVDSTKGAIDPAPFWDDDGQAWLVHGYAASRAGFANVITLKKMKTDGTQTLDAGVRIIEGDKLPKAMTSQGPMPWFTTEGPKLYKRGGYYYVFAPSGSVKGGWQGVFRAKRIDGPYEARNVMDQGDTAINGPHQGAWVDTPSGEDWFLHFSDTDSYGRRVFLQPMRWNADGWPVIGAQQGKQSYGAPVSRHAKPKVAAQPVAVPANSDEFDAGYHLGWQWAANPAQDWVDGSVRGQLRLKAVSSSANLWEAGNLLTQKLPGMAFSVTSSVELRPGAIGERAGLLVMGYDYAWIGLENTVDGLRLVQTARLKSNLGLHLGALQQSSETVVTAPVAVKGPVHVRLSFAPVEVAALPPAERLYWPSMLRATHAKVTFSYSLDGATFHPLGPAFTTQPGRWVGTQVGLFAQAPSGTPSFTATRVGYADFDYFRFSQAKP
ncbi:family 43 glycosylhydrolase [Massilia sp. FT127W]|uniref:Family 43 glycosylhydrolase n=2 Tax=Pseudoduganella aquatica TaxID=2660641 RepID=A0A7X4H821_9BURK|nr:family 43 glycosylhydrolase [Pseudoduganella aquatica]